MIKVLILSGFFDYRLPPFSPIVTLVALPVIPQIPSIKNIPSAEHQKAAEL